MTALITGGTGLLGSALLPNLPDAVVASHDPARASRKLGRGRAVRWDPEAEPAPLEALRGVEAVINLAGESVAEGRWTEAKKRRIRDSRVVGTRNLVVIAGHYAKPEAITSARTHQIENLVRERKFRSRRGRRVSAAQGRKPLKLCGRGESNSHNRKITRT